MWYDAINRHVKHLLIF